MNDLVLDVKGASHDPGTPVVTWFQKHEDNDNQLWYEDQLVGVIRSKLNKLCLDLNDDNELVLAEFESGRDNQQWLTAGDRVQSRSDSNRVLDIKGEERSEGATVLAWAVHGGDNQKWTFEYTSAVFFYIRSEMHGKVMDIKNRERDAGGKVVMMEKDEDAQDSQLWYEDKFGVVCNKVNECVLDSANECKIVLQPDEPGNTEQLWTIQENRIINRAKPQFVLDIKGAKHKNGAKLISWPWHGEDNQKWQFDYV